MSDQVVYDHEELASTVAKIREVTSNTDAITSSLDNLLNIMVEEASINSGSPAPVFGPVLNGAEGVITRLKQAVTTISERLNAGADVVESTNRQQQDIAEGSAGDVAKSTGPLSGGNGGGNTAGNGGNFLNQSGNQGGNQSGSQSGTQSGNQGGNQNQFGNQFGSQSGSQSGNQSGNQSGAQSGSQSGNQSGAQSGKNTPYSTF